ncbi:hypothetical protein XENTR_v10001223 [Xenopus tropicalis]|nr:hypothetical protein XENTR_v10001223 [Xenopus tropicalis]
MGQMILLRSERRHLFLKPSSNSKTIKLIKITNFNEGMNSQDIFPEQFRVRFAWPIFVLHIRNIKKGNLKAIIRVCIISCS